VLPGARCPLVVNGGCPAVAAADAVFFRLRLPDAADEAVLNALKAEAGRRPVIVEVPEPRVERLGGLLAGCRVLAMPASNDEIVEAVGQAVGVTPVRLA